MPSHLQPRPEQTDENEQLGAARADGGIPDPAPSRLPSSRVGPEWSPALVLSTPLSFDEDEIAPVDV